jgi:hypothetical protein
LLFEFGSRGGSGSLIHVRLRRPVSDLKLLQRPAGAQLNWKPAATI